PSGSSSRSQMHSTLATASLASCVILQEKGPYPDAKRMTRQRQDWKPIPQPTCRPSHLRTRQGHRTGRAFFGDAGELDLAAVRGDNRPGDTQAQAGSTLVAAASLVHSIEAVKDTWQMFRRDADTCVANRHDGVLVACFRPDFNRAALRRVFDRVIQEVVKDLAQANVVATHQ